jgi:PAS domain S-box-containing protein
LQNLEGKQKELYRANCMKFGYNSVAVIPIRYHGSVIGAIHLADKREGMVDVSKTDFIETAAFLIGEAVHRFNMEDELRASEQRYRQLVELSPEGIGVEVDGKIVFVNSAAIKVFGGQSAEEFINRQITDFIHPDFAKIAQRQLNRLRLKSKSLPLRESKFLHIDGTPFDVEVAATPLVYGQKQAAQIVFRDVTSRKAVEKQILENQEKLRSLTAQLVLTEERERRSVATELHDSIGPVLAFAKIELGSLQKVVPPKTSLALKSIMESITEAIQQTRTLTFDLSPPALYTFGFEIAVGELADKFAKDHELNINVEKTDEEKPLTDYSRVLLYRCVRELLINIVKHSKAENVSINLTRDNGNIKIVVEDDGKGFNIDGRDYVEGFGLFSIRERLTHIGGRIDIQSGKEQGTQVTLIAPLDINETVNKGEKANEHQNNTGR